MWAEEGPCRSVQTLLFLYRSAKSRLQKESMDAARALLKSRRHPGSSGVGLQASVWAHPPERLGCTALFWPHGGSTGLSIGLTPYTCKALSEPSGAIWGSVSYPGTLRHVAGMRGIEPPTLHSRGNLPTHFATAALTALLFCTA